MHLYIHIMFWGLDNFEVSWLFHCIVIVWQIPFAVYADLTQYASVKRVEMSVLR